MNKTVDDTRSQFALNKKNCGLEGVGCKSTFDVKINQDFCNDFFSKQFKTKNRNLDANIGKILAQEQSAKVKNPLENPSAEDRIKILEE